MLGEVKAGETVPKNLVVRGAKPFRVASITGPDDQLFRFTPPTEAKEVQVIGVQFTAGNKPGKIAGKIHITTDLGAAVDVDVDGQVVAADRPAAGGLGSGAVKPDVPKPDVARPEVPKPEAVKPEAKTASPRPGIPSLDSAVPGGNVLRPPGKLKPIEPEERPAEK